MNDKLVRGLAIIFCLSLVAIASADPLCSFINITTGPQGPPGADNMTAGPPGADGDAATININATFTGSNSTPASVTNIGTTTAALFDFVIPQGLMGAAGAPGADGAAATVAVNATFTASSGNPASVTNIGTATAALFNFVIPQGAAGIDGLDGTNASVEVNTTFTLDSTASAYVTNIGNSTTVVLDFGIPVGATGASGFNGTNGTNGIDGTNASVDVNATFTLDPGAQATVTNIGTITDVILDFGIPAGSDGLNGTNGTNGIDGIDGKNASVAINATFTLLPGSEATVANIGNDTSVVLDFGIPAGLEGTNGTNGIDGTSAYVYGNNTEVLYNIGGNATTSPCMIFDNTTGKLTACFLSGDGTDITNVTANAVALSFNVREGGVGNIYKGQAVYISGSTGVNVRVLPADNTATDSSRVVGLMVQDVTINGAGQVRRAGELAGVDTRATNLNVNPNGETWSAGDLLFATTGGGLTNVRPTSGRSVKVAYSLRGSHISDTLLAYPMENPVWITAASGENVVTRLGDSVGENKLSIRNYANAEVASINSLGNIVSGTDISAMGFDNDSYLKLEGGSASDNAGAQILLVGKNFSVIDTVKGDILFRVPNLTTDGFSTVIYIDDNTNKPIISFENNNLSKVGTPQVSTDAATKGYVDSASGGWDGVGAFFQNATRPITGSQINRSVKDNYLALDGGLGDSAGGATGGHFTLTGTDYSAFPGGIIFFVPNAANTSYLQVMNIKGSTNTPYLDMLKHDIVQTRIVSGGEFIGGGGELRVNDTSAPNTVEIRSPHILPSPASDLFISIRSGTTAVDNVSFNSHRISDVTDPLYAQDVATKAYADSVGGGGDTSGFAFTNGTRPFTRVNLTENVTGITKIIGPTDGTNKSYVDSGTPYYRAVVAESDFYDPSTNAIPGFLGAAVSSGTVGLITSTADHPGVIYMRDSTTANGGYRYGCAGGMLIAGGEYFDVIFQPVGVRVGQTAKLGWSDSAAARTLPVDGVYFNISATGAAITLRGNTSSNSVHSGTATTYAPTTATWYRGTIQINSAGSLATFTLYNAAGAQVWTDTVATNIPTGASRVTSPCITVSEETTDAAADILRMDYVKWAIDRTLAR